MRSNFRLVASIGAHTILFLVGFLAIILIGLIAFAYNLVKGVTS